MRRRGKQWQSEEEERGARWRKHKQTMRTNFGKGSKTLTMKWGKENIDGEYVSVKNSEIKKLSDKNEDVTQNNKRDWEMWWHAALSWCLWSVSCHCMWLIRPCYCNANRLSARVCRRRQQIKKMFPLYCHRRHLSVSLSVSFAWMCRCVCLLCRTPSFTAPLLQKQDSKFSSFVFFVQGRWLTGLRRAIC